MGLLYPFTHCVLQEQVEILHQPLMKGCNKDVDLRINNINSKQPVLDLDPVAARSKAYFCNRFLLGLRVRIPAGT
jgi:hypothetical protein